MRNRRMLSDHRYAMRYIYPAFFMLGAVLLVPLGFSVVASLMRWNLVPRRIHWLGLDNYIQIFRTPRYGIPYGLRSSLPF